MKEILWIAVAAVAGVIVIVGIAVIGCIARRRRRLANKLRSQLNPYTE
jgi:hypothetical protein